MVTASGLGSGRVVALGDENFWINEALGLLDNKKFGNNVVDWLDGLSTKKILITTGHREWVGGSNFDDLKSELETLGYTVTRLPGVLTSASLSGIGVVMIGNAWGMISQSEVETLQTFVTSGGGLLLMGLGWSWEPYNPGLTLDDYPMNVLGEVFGVRWIRGYVNDPTNNYNGQPIFHTFYPNVELQTIYQAFSYIETTTGAHPSDLPAVVQNDLPTRRRYTNAHMLLATATSELSEPSAQRQEIYDFYKDLISGHPRYFAKGITYNRVTQSSMAWIRERVYRSFVDALPLTEARKGEIATTLQLAGLYLDIWKEFSVLLLDNTALSVKQLDFVHALLGLIPSGLHNLRTISVADNLGTTAPEVSLSGRNGGVNIFGLSIGALQENGFPSDVPPTYSDVFCLVVAHEVNHVVDAFYISNDAGLRSRKDDLVRRAGNDHLNYLRSMLPDGFFSSAPQEFFASISNQWFANSALTLELALVRFDRGYTEPLNQFLFFAEVYSERSGSTLFYTLDTQGNILRREVPVMRDRNGRIAAIIDGETMYNFTLDGSGNVISYSARQAPSFCGVSIDTSPRLAANVTVDGARFAAEQLPVNLTWIAESTHSLEVPAMIQVQSNVRYVFEAWADGNSSSKRTVSVSSSSTFVAQYRAEYFLSISSPYGNPVGEGWYTRGRIAELSVQGTVDQGNGTRRVLKGWFKDQVQISSGSTVSIEISEPASLEIGWDTEYYVNASTPMGVVSGAAWYDVNASAMVSISPIQLEKDIFTNYVFEGWKVAGTIVSTSTSYSFTMIGPVSLTASWKTELNLVTTSAVAGVAILLIAAVVLLMSRRSKSSGSNKPRTDSLTPS
jgi:hypothetical protein